MHRCIRALGLSVLCASHVVAGPQIRCEAQTFEFGTRYDHEIITHQFTLSNAGDAPLVIERIKASCGCTAATPSKNRILPGETATIDTRFNPRGRHGLQRKSILVQTNDPQRPQIRLWLKGNIVVEVALNPRYMNFRQIHKDQVSTQHVDLVSIRPDVHITGVESDTEFYKATIDTDGRGLTIATVPPLEPGLVRGYMKVATDHPQKLTADLNIVGVAVGDLIVLPKVLTLRQSAPPARPLILIVRPFAELPFAITRVTVPDPSITASIIMVQDGTARIELRGVTPAPALDGKSIVLHTNITSTPQLSVTLHVVP